MEQKSEAAYYFHQGTAYRAYEYLGCNFKKKNGKYHYTFRTWAPSAEEVGVVSDFNGWDTPIPMTKVTEKGVWECHFKSDVSLSGKLYKYKIKSHGKTVLKGDPYARYSKGKSDGASIIYESKYKWDDSVWRKRRKIKMKSKKGVYLPIPVNIYELHIGSFIRHRDNSYYSYRELADILVPYMKYMGYTHVEFLPVAEHPYDGSWGYQVCGFYAPSSRFGTPDDFRFLVDSLHKNGIGVIMDWVGAHFPKDEWGLYEFDGAPLYEYQGLDRQESSTWGTRFFDVGREEVQSFLISSALYFFREFHIDGIRVDAVASMLYLDYDRKDGEWIPNVNGGRENLEAIAFLQKLNEAVFSEFADVLMIAEESGSFQGITRPTCQGGLGFNLKWNMGWANDFYDYIMTNPIYRKYKHKALNFPLMYAFSENYVMPISHDEVVHGKLSLIDKMYGKYEDKFKEMRSSLMLLMTYPGKKLLFMGCEFAQFREWDFANSLEWFMLDYPEHRAMREYTAALNRFYLESPELWEIDFEERGFEWILADENEKNTVAYRRKDLSGNSLTVVINFSGESQTVSFESSPLVSAFDTGEVPIVENEKNGFVKITLPAFSGAIFKSAKRKIKL